MLPSPRLALGVLACTVLVGCEHGQPLAPEGPHAPRAPTVLAALTCTATVATGAVSCENAPPGTGAAAGLIVGGQGTYVFLQASNTVHDGTANTFTMDVTVQNLIPQALGTTDGSATDPAGVRVFFDAGPTGVGGSATILNATGTAFFLSAGQPYFQWNEVLHPSQTSGALSWQFGLDETTTSFWFLVYVAAQVQFPDGWVDLTPSADTLVAGGSTALTATVRSVVGTALPGETVTFGSVDPAIATVAGDGTVSAVAPGATTLTATSGSRSGSAAIAVCPDLEVGDAYTAVMPAASGLCLAGGDAGAAEYTYMPVNLSAASTLSLTVTGTGIVSVTGPPTPELRPAGSPLLARGAAGGPAFDDDFHLRLMRRDARELAPLAGRPSARIGVARRPGGPSLLITPGVPAVGALMDLNVARGCSGTRDDRTGRVMSVGDHVIIVADTLNPSGGFTTAQYDSIALEFDSIAHDVVVDNFGAPTDLDSNGRVVAFYTRAVNELSDSLSSAVVAGYVTARDLFSSAAGSCTLSNEGEMFYMLVPDPAGEVNGNVRTVSSVRGNTVGTLGHEFQHLVNFARRIYVNTPWNGTFEEVWLNEGLSHITEELLFYRMSAGLAPRGNIVLSDINSGPTASQRVAAFNSYANANYSRLRSWLQRPDTAGPVQVNGDTIATLATRGAIWGFLRYAADRRNGVDATLWYDLVNTSSTGKTNLQQRLGVDPDLWVRDFAAAMYADDAVAGVGAEYQTTSWNYRSVYSGLGGFPLLPRPLSSGVGLTLSYSAGGGTAFARLGVPTGAFAGITALSAGIPPVSPYALIVVRTK